MRDRLTLKENFQSSDWVVIYDNTNGYYRAVSGSELQNYMQQNLTLTNVQSYKSQYFSPSSDGFVIPSDYGADSEGSVHVLLTPTMGFTNGVATLPSTEFAKDGMLYSLTTTQGVGVFTFDVNGATGVFGPPNSLSIGDSFTIRYDKTTNTWYGLG